MIIQAKDLGQQGKHRNTLVTVIIIIAYDYKCAHRVAL